MAKKCTKGLKLKDGKCVRVANKRAKKIEGTGMKVFLGVALALIFFGLFNLGVATFYDGPEWDDYCGENAELPWRTDWTESECMNIDGVWKDGKCDVYGNCSEEYDSASDSYDNTIFYIFVVVGMLLAIAGLFITSLPFQIVGIGAGTALVIEGILRNLQDKIPAFIAGVVAFVILSYFVWRKFR